MSIGREGKKSEKKKKGKTEGNIEESKERQEGKYLNSNCLLRKVKEKSKFG